MANSDLFVLEKQYTFYKTYHTNSVNKKIHVVFTPLLLISALVLLADVPFPSPSFDLAKLVTVTYICYCILLDATTGVIFSLIILAMYIASYYLRLYTGPINSTRVAIIIQIVSWAAQIIGHMAFEKKSPAFTKSVLQAFTAGPFSTYLDSLFAFGFFPKKKAKLARAKVAHMARKASAKANQRD